MDDSRLLGLLRNLDRERSEHAWSRFLEAAAPVLLQVARAVERDADDAADAFLFVCQRLADDEYARLRKFDPAGPASFLTWLRTVARNLCIDAQRRRRGRFRLPKRIGTLPTLHQAVLRLRYRDGLSLSETVAILEGQFPGLTREKVALAEHGIANTLSSRQLFATLASRHKTEPLLDRPSAPGGVDPEDEAPTPEERALKSDQLSRLFNALDRLCSEERLMVRLRFDQDLTLTEIARLLGLNDAAQVHRRLQSIIERLRGEVV